MGLIAASDIVLASKSARFGLPEVQLGIMPAVVMAPLLLSVNRKTVADWIFTGKKVTAEEAYASGLISQIYADESLEAETEKYCAQLASRSRKALICGKELLSSLKEDKSSASLLNLADKVTLLSQSDEARTYINAFLSK